MWLIKFLGNKGNVCTDEYYIDSSMTAEPKTTRCERDATRWPHHVASSLARALRGQGYSCCVVKSFSTDSLGTDGRVRVLEVQIADLTERVNKLVRVVYGKDAGDSVLPKPNPEFCDYEEKA